MDYVYLSILSAIAGTIFSRLYYLSNDVYWVRFNVYGFSLKDWQGKEDFSEKKYTS
jgi:hypothetical protein